MQLYQHELRRRQPLAHRAPLVLQLPRAVLVLPGEGLLTQRISLTVYRRSGLPVGHLGHAWLRMSINVIAFIMTYDSLYVLS